MVTEKDNTKNSPEWHLVDASSDTLGRVATRTAELLMGKHRVDHARHIVAPVYVVVTNAEKLRVTGNKLDGKVYYHHTGYPGGLKERTLRTQMIRDPRKVIEAAVSGMLPKNNLRPQRLRHLKIYTGTEHPHQAQLSGKPSEDTVAK